ncbi:MAG: hypothetical protein FD147_772 [Chloroflexi bacterium]|nr:MAG: hypothetical protein FD147_772 [Chloroflexota bacterium]MBA4375364.1 hypothetical protein [Anaerolinea sp.]
MVTQFDEKGKIFTTLVSKQPVKVLIQLLTNQILGEIHVKRDGRLKDELDSTPKYIAVTNASILSVDGSTTLTKCRFMTINNNQIVWIIPETDLLSSEPAQ